MPAEWRKAPHLVIEIAERIIAKHHPDLLDARIGFLMRSEAPKRGNGMVVYGKAKKISDEMKTLWPYDFVIWLAEDCFNRFSALQREALIDHELMHCLWDKRKQAAKLRSHDLEEFNVILQRYGLWWPASDATAIALQPHLPLDTVHRGGVEAVDVKHIFRAVKEGMEDAFDDVEVSFAGMGNGDDKTPGGRPFPTTAVDA